MKATETPVKAKKADTSHDDNHKKAKESMKHDIIAIMELMAKESRIEEVKQAPLNK